MKHTKLISNTKKQLLINNILLNLTVSRET